VNQAEKPGGAPPLVEGLHGTRPLDPQPSLENRRHGSCLTILRMVVKQLIVRRDLDERYSDFLRAFARVRGLDLIVDRRFRERRQRTAPVEPDRRAGERRGAPPASWPTADFIIVEPPS